MSPTRVDPAAWLMHFAGLRDEGMVWFDFLTAIDRGDHVDVIARVADPLQSISALVTTAVTNELDSLTLVHPGSSWHERETQEMFGIRFRGLRDQRPLIYREFFDPPPLRKAAKA